MVARADGPRKTQLLPIDFVMISISFEDLLGKAYKLEQDIDIRLVLFSGCEIGCSLKTGKLQRDVDASNDSAPRLHEFETPI